MPILDPNTGRPFPPANGVQPNQQGRMARVRDHAGSMFDPPDSFALPHVWTFSAVLGSAYRTYWHDRWDEAMRHAREDAIVMRNDCHLMRLLQERKLAVSSLPWHLKVPDEKDPYQCQVRDDLTQRLKMWRGFTKFRYTLQEALWYGRYANQIKWHWVPAQDTPAGRALAVQKWIPTNGDKIGHAYDGTPYVLVYSPAAQGLANAELTITTRGWALMLRGDWRERFILHSHEVDDMDFFDAEQAEAVHGRGIRSVLFWLDWIAREWLANACTFMQRVGLGMTVWYYEAGNPASEAQAAQAAKEQSGRVNILWPRSAGGKGTGSGVERIEVPTGGASFLLEAQKWIKELQELYVIGQTMSSGADNESGLGGTGRAKFAQQTKMQIRDFDAINQADSLTGDENSPGLIYIMQKWTWPGTVEHFPVWFEYELESSESKEKLEAAARAWEMGATLKEDDILSAAGLSKPTPQDQVLSKGQQEQQALQQQTAAQGQQQQVELQAQQQGQAADREHQLRLEQLRGQQRQQEAAAAQGPVIQQYFQDGRPARYNVTDKEGHEHGGDGRFVGQGGSSDSLGKWTGKSGHKNDQGLLRAHGRQQAREKAYDQATQDWEDRQAARQERMEAADALTDDDPWEVSGKGKELAALDPDAGGLDPDRLAARRWHSEEGMKAYRDQAEAWGKASAELFGQAFGGQLERLKALGGNEKLLAKGQELVEKGKAMIGKVADKYLAKVDRATALQARLDAHELNDPTDDEPEEPGPDLDKWKQEMTAWEQRKEDLEARVEAADDAELTAKEDVETAVETASERVMAILGRGAEELGQKLAREQEKDEEPEEQASDIEPEVKAAAAAIEKGINTLGKVADGDEETEAFDRLQEAHGQIGQEPEYDHQALADYLDAGKDALAVFSQAGKPEAVQAIRGTMAEALRALRAIYARQGRPVRTP